MRTISKHAALMFSVLKWGILFVVSLGLVLFFLLWLMLSSLGETTVYTKFMGLPHIDAGCDCVRPTNQCELSL